jgi:hypothetical protein
MLRTDYVYSPTFRRIAAEVMKKKKWREKLSKRENGKMKGVKL